MGHKSYRDESRADWGSSAPGNLTLEQVKTGALLRIADATEAMAKRHVELIDKCERLKRQVRYLECQARNSEHSNRALRGVITKLKRKST